MNPTDQTFPTEPVNPSVPNGPNYPGNPTPLIPGSLVVPPGANYPANPNLPFDPNNAGALANLNDLVVPFDTANPNQNKVRNEYNRALVDAHGSVTRLTVNFNRLITAVNAANARGDVTAAQSLLDNYNPNAQ